MQIPKEGAGGEAYLAFASSIVLSPTLTWRPGLLHSIALCPESFMDEQA